MTSTYRFHRRRCTPWRHRRYGFALLAFCLTSGLAAAPTAARAAESSEAPAEQVQASWDTGAWLRPSDPIEVWVDPALERDGSRIAFFVGATDRTDFFRRDGDRFVHRSDVVPLPRGQSEVVVWRIDAERSWTEVARLPLQVLRRGGLETFEIATRLDVEGTSGVDTGGDPEAPESQDARSAGQFDVQTHFGRGPWRVAMQGNVVGVSRRDEALRFFTEGAGAPQVDLSSYRVGVEQTVAHGVRSWTLGHVFWGSSRHLVDQFQSRGTVVSLPLGPAADVSAAALNGTSIVGWDNPFGLDRSAHRVTAARVGVELMPSLRGGLRLEATALDGSLLPLDDFNQGLVSDREESDGWSLRLQASTPSQRLRLDGGFASSTFDNPFDPFLAQGEVVVPVEEETRDARYLDVDLALVRGRMLSETRSLDLTLALRHERVDPLYRSVGASTQSDVERNTAELNGILGGSSLFISWSESEDNLDDIPSILTTRTEAGTANVAIPLSELIGSRGDGEGEKTSSAASLAAWPVFTWTAQRTHQRGLGVPVGGGFSASHVPDQISWNHVAGLQWNGAGWSVAYQLSISDQDNRQPGRETADFRATVHGLTTMFSVHPRLDLGFDWSTEEAENLGLNEVTETDSLGLTLAWRPTDALSVNGTISWTDTESDPATVDTENVVGDLRASWRFSLAGSERGSGSRHGIDGQIYLRWAYERFETFDLFFDALDFRRTWRLTTGLNVSFF